jgi:hypothetical protein
VLLIAFFVISWRDRAIISIDDLRGRLIRKKRGQDGNKENKKDTVNKAAP